MINIVDLYNRFASLVNTFQGGFYRPQTDFERGANDVNMDIWNDFTGRAEKTQEITDYLTPFARTKNIIVKKENSYYGVADFPTDYARYSSSRIIVHKGETIKCSDVNDDANDAVEKREEYLEGVQEHIVEKIDDSRWAACLQHLTKKPTLEAPKMVQFSFKKGDGVIQQSFKVSPRQVSVIVLSYYIKPDYVKFVYTLAPGNVQTGAGDYIIPDVAASGNFLWNETMINEFLIRLGEKYALFTRSQFLAMSMNQQKVS